MSGMSGMAGDDDMLRDDCDVMRIMKSPPKNFLATTVGEKELLRTK